MKALVKLEDYVKERKGDKAGFKKLSPSQGRSLNRLGLVLRKQGKTYSKLMKELRDGGISSEEESAGEEPSLI